MYVCVREERKKEIGRMRKTLGKVRGLAERRDEKLDLQICLDYYEIARLPNSDSQLVPIFIILYRQ